MLPQIIVSHDHLRLETSNIKFVQVPHVLIVVIRAPLIKRGELLTERLSLGVWKIEIHLQWKWK